MNTSRHHSSTTHTHQQPAMHHHCDIQARIIKSCNKLTQGQVAYYTQDPVARPCCLGYLCSSQVSCTNHAIFKPRCHHWRLATTSTNLATGSENKNQDPPTRINFEEKPASYLQSWELYDLHQSNLHWSVCSYNFAQACVQCQRHPTNNKVYIISALVSSRPLIYLWMHGSWFTHFPSFNYVCCIVRCTWCMPFYLNEC